MFGVIIIGHQGGWDEILYVAGPVVLIASLLWVAHKRANRLPHRLGNAADDTTNTGETTH